MKQPSRTLLIGTKVIKCDGDFLFFFGNTAATARTGAQGKLEEKYCQQTLLAGVCKRCFFFAKRWKEMSYNSAE
jgi:hypothetical protein